MLREKLLEQDPSLELSKLNKETSNKFKQAQNKEKELSNKENDKNESCGGDIMKGTIEKAESQERKRDPEMELMSKCLALMLRSRNRPSAAINPPVRRLFNT